MVRAQFPDLWKHFTGLWEQEPMLGKMNEAGEKYAGAIDKVLGEKVEAVNDQLIDGQERPVQTIVEKVISDSGLTKEIQAQIETKIIEKSKEVQGLPQEAIDEIRRQVKAEIRRQICEGWLPEE